MSDLPILRIMLIDFSNIKPPLNSPYKSYIIMADYRSNVCGIGFACVSLRIFDPAFPGKIPELSLQSLGAGAILTSSGSRNALVEVSWLQELRPPRPRALDAMQETPGTPGK